MMATTWKLAYVQSVYIPVPIVCPAWTVQHVRKDYSSRAANVEQPVLKGKYNIF